mmetsp:Transcript_21730/g.39189  ORF Transcript_21730/g.39189 Transcript_21730/m.39189 type:complete len:369 (-) Transcript_21730:672-1778(-)
MAHISSNLHLRLVIFLLMFVMFPLSIHLLRLERHFSLMLHIIILMLHIIIMHSHTLTFHLLRSHHLLSHPRHNHLLLAHHPRRNRFLLLAHHPRRNRCLLLGLCSIHISRILRNRHGNLRSLLCLDALMHRHGRIQIRNCRRRLLRRCSGILLLHIHTRRRLLLLPQMLLRFLLLGLHRRPIIGMDISRRHPCRQMRLHVHRRGIHRRMGIHGINPRHLPRRRDRIMRRNRNPIGANHLHHGRISRLGNGRERTRGRHGKPRNDIRRIGALSSKLFLDRFLGHARLFHRFPEAGRGFHGAFFRGPGGTVLEREAGRGELLGHFLDVGGGRDAMGVSRPIGTVAVSQRLARLLDRLAPTEFLPRTIETA